MEVWIREGYGDSNDQKYNLKRGETVGDLINQFSNKLGVQRDEIEVTTDTKRLTNEHAEVAKLVTEGETISIMPRAKAGKL